MAFGSDLGAMSLARSLHPIYYTSLWFLMKEVLYFTECDGTVLNLLSQRTFFSSPESHTSSHIAA